MFEKCQNTQTAELFPPLCVDFPCHTRSMAASNRLDRRKNLSPLCISSFINQGLAPWRRKRGRGLQAADAGGLAPYHPWGLPRPVPLGRGWRPSRTTAQPLAAGFTSPVKSAERRSFGARLCRLTDAASPLRGQRSHAIPEPLIFCGIFVDCYRVKIRDISFTQ